MNRLNIISGPNELVLVLHHLRPDVLGPPALGVVHPRHLDGLGLGVHVGVSHRGVETWHNTFKLSTKISVYSQPSHFSNGWDKMYFRRTAVSGSISSSA